MDCREFEAKLWAFLDGELDAAACAQLRAHLEDCPGCLDHYRFEDALRLFVRRCCQETVPDALRARLDRLLARLEE
ncbi:MAG: mycothiol system anti-sigma-R factor [Armatimonadota bacterium]|nr:mycothiol system anti-sigma-R factor [Bacillota bacterium]MDQ7800648.1 mycothiol system anti-sigma-R factor [Armatimonadota bacterium]MDR5689721.1 mycothiol system anti-sigma-R factor [Armatimonadota bacterium]MDR7386367.1 mycothiol system anti-sigma-R factor [Armatimonadota bacterium]MDR7390045.1 mycothiol system anti-sigma-R factor [Armatimonadota bacterium]